MSIILACYDVRVMRTTLYSEQMMRSSWRGQLARRKRVSLGEAVSELVRRGRSFPSPRSSARGLTVVRLPRGSARVTAAAVEDLLEDLP